MLIRLFQQTAMGSIVGCLDQVPGESLRQFQQQFASEDACAEYLTACRWPDGFRCPRCGQTSAYRFGRPSALAVCLLPLSGLCDGRDNHFHNSKTPAHRRGFGLRI